MKDMVKMTFDEYDKLMDVYGGMQEHPYWPTDEQIEMFGKNPEKWLLFCIFLHEKNPAPSSESERQSKRKMMKFINRELELVDG